jgi:hypothetical protein
MLRDFYPGMIHPAGTCFLYRGLRVLVALEVHMIFLIPFLPDFGRAEGVGGFFLALFPQT